MKYIGIIGSRRRCETRDYLALHREFSAIYDQGDMIVSGGCSKGGDSFAEFIAKDIGISIIIHYPVKRDGIKGLSDRNTLVARDADVLIACVAPGRTGGTEDTIAKFKRMHPSGRVIHLLRMEHPVTGIMSQSDGVEIAGEM